MVDERIKKLAKNLVRYSCDLQKGEKILIEAKGVDYPLINEIIKEVYAVGGLPFVEIYDNRVTRQLLLGETEELAALRAKFDGARMAEMDAYIGIRGGNNGKGCGCQYYNRQVGGWRSDCFQGRHRAHDPDRKLCAGG